MKYISLIGAMKLYGAYVDNYRSFRSLTYEMASRGFDAQRDYTAFTITTGEPNAAGQVTKTIRFRDGQNVVGVMGRTQPTTNTMFPILEIEWLKSAMGMVEEYSNVLEYLAYMFIMQFITWGEQPINLVNPVYYNELLERKNAVIELDNLNNAPSVLSVIELPDIKLPKIKSWNMFYLYETDFQSLISLCCNQSQSTKELYHHLPIMLAMFMVTCRATKLKSWMKTERIHMENKLQDLIHGYDTHQVAAARPYTYGGSVSVTGQDIALLKYVLDSIRKEIHELNNDIGLITLMDYQHIRGPETIRANVRLSGMSIDWHKELKKAEDEKKAREEEAEG